MCSVRLRVDFEKPVESSTAESADRTAPAADRGRFVTSPAAGKSKNKVETDAAKWSKYAPSRPEKRRHALFFEEDFFDWISRPRSSLRGWFNMTFRIINASLSLFVPPAFGKRRF